jgi:mRNA interferase MazF
MSNLIVPFRGDVYWANLEPVVGSEQGGCRPVLIISNTLMNESATIVIIIPMTRNEEKIKVGPFNISIPLAAICQDVTGISALRTKGHLFSPQDGVLLCNHARTVSKSRLIGKVGKCIDSLVIKEVENAIKHSFALDACECGVPLRPDGLICARCKINLRIKCVKCGLINSNKNNYCPMCGGGIKNAKKF